MSVSYPLINPFHNKLKIESQKYHSNILGPLQHQIDLESVFPHIVLVGELLALVRMFGGLLQRVEVMFAQTVGGQKEVQIALQILVLLFLAHNAFGQSAALDLELRNIL